MKCSAAVVSAFLLASIVTAHAGDQGGINPAAKEALDQPLPASEGISAEMIDLLADGVIAKLRAKPEILLDIILRYEEKMKPVHGMIHPDDPVSGSKDADVTVVQFFDPGCAPCRATATAVDQAAAADGKIRIITKEFPTTPEAVTMSIAALGAKDYKAAHAAVLAGLTPPSPDAAAAAKASAAIERNRATAARYQVGVLPSMFVVGDGTGARLDGPQSAAQILDKVRLIRAGRVGK